LALKRPLRENNSQEDGEDGKEPSVSVMRIGFGLLGSLASAALLGVWGSEACNEGTPASPSSSSGPSVEAGSAIVPVDAGAVEAGDSGAPPLIYAVCPDGMAPTFPSLLTKMFATSGCGVGDIGDCHSPTGALPIAEGGTGSGLDFSLGAAQVYTELLGDGGGMPAKNVAGDAGGLLRVVPGDASASLLYIKLAMPTNFDPRYGQAMPISGAPCPATLDTVRAWIDDGAAPN
jgi:hypothetical protein